MGCAVTAIKDRVVHIDDRRPGIALVDHGRKIATHVTWDYLRSFINGETPLDMTEDEIRIIISLWMRDRGEHG